MNSFADAVVAALTAMNSRPEPRRRSRADSVYLGRQPQTEAEQFAASVVAELTRLNPRGSRLSSPQAALARVHTATQR